jgi:hypothetical protein
MDGLRVHLDAVDEEADPNNALAPPKCIEPVADFLGVIVVESVDVSVVEGADDFAWHFVFSWGWYTHFPKEGFVSRMYHPYKDGYSTLPNLRKIGPEEVFEREQGESGRIMGEKRSLLASCDPFLEADCSEGVLDRLAAWVGSWHPWRPLGGFRRVASSIPEDLLVHRLSGERDWLAAAHVCFPSGWDPREKMGLSWEAVHEPVPMDLGSSRKIVRAMVGSGPFERFVWSVVHDRRYDFSPWRPRSSFSLERPVVLVKVERQVTVPFPELGCCLFVLRQYLVEDYDREALARAIEGMDEEQRRYKGLVDPRELLGWLGAQPSSLSL